VSAIARLVSSLPQRGRDVFARIVPPPLQNWIGSGERPAAETLFALAQALLSTRGEASGVAIAQDVLTLYGRCTKDAKAEFFTGLGRSFGPDKAALEEAWASYREKGDSQLPLLAKALEAPRQELFRRLNLAPGGTGALVRMRADLLLLLRSGDPLLKVVESDLCHVLQSWFNRGFLSMRPITWSSPARLLESVIRFEAVHHINGWDDLRRRLDPPDRRCYAFFHPAMADEPLIFVEVALTRGMADNVQAILREDRMPLAAAEADTANFYSISNCQEGLRGISFGHFLIKQVAMDLKRELPNLKRFATLSPIPGFISWLQTERPDRWPRLGRDWWQDPSAAGERDWLIQAVADYLLHAKNKQGQPLDPVARFHLGNGARLERLNWLADTSPKGLGESAGLMVNYLYDLAAIEENHEAFAHSGAIAASRAVRRLAQPDQRHLHP
jgi:malonyl-CoA decarboxylase